MSAIAQRIQNIAQNIQSGNVSDLQSGLKQIADIPKQQLVANQTSITYPVQQLTEAVQRNVKLNQNQIQNSQQLQRLLNRAAQNLPNQLRRQVTPVIRNIQRQAQNAQLTTQIDKQVKRATQQIQKRIQSQAAKQNDLVTLHNRDLSISSRRALTPIELSVQQFLPMFNINVPKVTRADQLPQTMKLLSQYAKLKGRIGVGTVTNQPGSSYVGVRQVDRGDGIKQYFPYQHNQIKKSDIPSIPMQLQYHANKTINSWNNYVHDQSRFINYFSKVNTSQNRLKYVQTQFKALNQETFCAQAIASLIFYYVFLPMQKMLNQISYGAGIQPTFENFIKYYQQGDTPKTNPLLLNYDQSTKLVKQIFQFNLIPSACLEKITNFFVKEKVENDLNRKQFKKFVSYIQSKLSQSRQFLQGNGLSKNLIDQVLSSSDWSSVKKRKMVLNGNFQNSQLIQMAKKVVANSQTQKINNINIQWGSSQIICFDYIWSWKSV